MSSASVIPQDALGTEKPLTQKETAQKNETPLIRATFFYMLEWIFRRYKNDMKAIS